VSAKHFDVLLHTLDRSRPQRRPLSVPVNKLAEFFAGAACWPDFGLTRSRTSSGSSRCAFGNDLMVFHVLIAPSLVQLRRFELRDLERRADPGRPRIARQAARAQEAAIDALTTKFSEHGRLRALNTSKPLDHALSRFANRERMMRVRYDVSHPLVSRRRSALAILVLVHLIQRERARRPFPSLTFVRRIPYQSVRRRSIRHWLLLCLRALAMLLFAAFARRSSRRAPSRPAPPAGRASSSCCSTNRPAWATAIAGSRRARRRTGRSTRCRAKTAPRWCCFPGMRKRTCARRAID
jgi:hypothetical protein